MLKNPFYVLMDDIGDIIETAPADHARELLIRRAHMAGAARGIEALARALVLEASKRRYAESKFKYASEALADRG